MAPFSDSENRPFTPSTTARLHGRRPLYLQILPDRAAHYNLDYPPNVDREMLDPASRFYARQRPRTLNLPQLLPYETELPADAASFLSHIVSHLYIAVMSLDIASAITILAKDLAQLRDAVDINDVDLAFETDMFEPGGREDDMDVDSFAGAGIPSDSDEEEEDEDDEDEDDPTEQQTVQHKKSPRLAAIVGLRVWTHELLVWIKMKNDMPVFLRVALAKVYYAICLSRGLGVNIKIFVKMFDLLVKNTDLLREGGLMLPWKPLYQALANNLPQADPTLPSTNRIDHVQLLTLAETASMFFDPEALPDIFASIWSHSSITNAGFIVSHTTMLPIVFTDDATSSKDIRYYLAPMFFFWAKLNKSSDIDSNITLRLGVISMTALIESPEVIGTHGIYNPEQFDHLVRVLMNGLGILPEKYGSTTTKFYHGFASCLVFSITEKSFSLVLSHLHTVLNAIVSYVHPSNAGTWTRPISSFVNSVVYQLIKRFNMEREPYGQLHKNAPHHKLSDSQVAQLIDVLLPVIRLGIQSKDQDASDDFLTCLASLAHMDPPRVLSFFLLELYESLEGVLSTHRTWNALALVEELIRYFAGTPIFRVHIPKILLLTISGIDSNDLDKTLQTLNIFASAGNFVPFFDLSEDGDPNLAVGFIEEHLQFLHQKLVLGDCFSTFEVSPEVEVSALGSSSSVFKQIFRTLAERICLLLLNLPDPNKSTGAERDVSTSLPRFLFVIIEAMSDDIFHAFRDYFFSYVTENTHQIVAEVFAEICGGLIKREPAYIHIIAPQLCDRIRDEIQENGAGASRTGTDVVPRDQPLYWCIAILNECVGNALSEVKKMGSELNEISFYLMQNVRGPCAFSSAFLVNQMLQACTRIMPAETRLIPPSYVAREGVDEKCWGGFQFDARRFTDEFLNLEWFLPLEEDVTFAIDSFAAHVTACLQKITSLIDEYASDGTEDSWLVEELRVAFLYLSYSLSGVSFLLDPSFEEDIPKIFNREESIQERIDLLSQIRDVKQFTDNVVPENVSENLQKIVSDIGKAIPEHPEELELVMNVRTKSPSVSDPTSRDSHSATPKLEEDVHVSLMSPGVTFRDRKLYTCRYFFGDDIETRRRSELYIKVHRIRHLIGKSLHVIAKFLVLNFSENIRLFKHFVHVMNIWFCDMGRERLTDESHARISSSYVESLQTINRVRKPYTRIAFATRVEAYHTLRVALHATARTQTDLDKVLLEDLVRLSFSTYAAVAELSQAVLTDAMKRINGSYNTVVRCSFRELARALDENNIMKIETGLRLFHLRRIKSRLQLDFMNLQKYMELLYRAMAVDKRTIFDLAHRLFKGLYTNLSLPASVAVIDEDAVASIKPPDEFIELEVRAIRIAKDRKRRSYMERIHRVEETVLAQEKHNSHWKVTLLNLNYLVALHMDYEVPLSYDAMRLLVVLAASDHPTIARFAVNGFTSIFNKAILDQMYNYDRFAMLDYATVPRGFIAVETTGNYQQTFQKELRSASPLYYLDTKISSGWLFWGERVLVNSPHPLNDLHFTPADDAIVKGLGELIDKDWLLKVVTLWQAEIETLNFFQEGDVRTTTTLVLLITSGYVTKISLADVLGVITKVYVADEKSAHILTAELLAGVLIGLRYMDETLLKQRDEFVVPFIANIFENDLTSDVSNVWIMFSWWVPSQVDPRRFPKVVDLITGFSVDPNSDKAVRDSTRLDLVQTFAAAVTWRFSEVDTVKQMCLQNITNHYQTIRLQLGKLLAVLVFSHYKNSFSGAQEFLTLANESGNLFEHGQDVVFLRSLPLILDQIEAWRHEVVGLSTHEILNSNYIYGANTALMWIKQGLNTSMLYLYQQYADSHIIPFLLHLMSMRDVCQLGNIDPLSPFKKASQICFTPETLEKVVVLLENLTTHDLNYVQLMVLSEFTETLFFRNLVILTATQRARIIRATGKLLFHKNAHVREAEASTFSGLIYTTPPNEVEPLLAHYTRQFTADLDRVRKRYRKTRFANVSAEDTSVLHGATLGLAALVHAFPYVSPPPSWMLLVLETLSLRSSGIPGMVGKTAKDAFVKFKKNRQDTWQVDVLAFNEGQLENIEGGLWRSYII